MGVCIQKSTTSFNNTKPNKNNLKQSFLYSSFTYDPSYIDESDFFFFDLPHYCQIQYILRKSSPQQESSELQANIQQHIDEIDAALTKLNNENFIPGSKLTQSESFKKKEKAHQTEQKIQVNQHFVTKESLDTGQFSNTLNLEIFSVTLEECQDMQEVPFHVSLNDKKIITITGNIIQNKWKPNSNSKFSLPNIHIDMENTNQQSKLKIFTELEGRQLECTIPCNKIVFKYIIPVLQTSNLRGKGDNEPLGHVHFKIEYVGDFETHKKKVVQDLLARKQGLESILSTVRSKQEHIGDRSLIIEDHNESFRSDIKQE